MSESTLHDLSDILQGDEDEGQNAHTSTVAGDPIEEEARGHLGESQDECWKCDECSFKNKLDDSECSVCGNAKNLGASESSGEPSLGVSSSKAAALSEDDVEDSQTPHSPSASSANADNRWDGRAEEEIDWGKVPDEMIKSSDEIVRDVGVAFECECPHCSQIIKTPPGVEAFTCSACHKLFRAPTTLDWASFHVKRTMELLGQKFSEFLNDNTLREPGEEQNDVPALQRPVPKGIPIDGVASDSAHIKQEEQASKAMAESSPAQGINSTEEISSESTVDVDEDTIAL